MSRREDHLGGEHEGDIALTCVSLLVDELVRGGMEHACISPGSRSTAIALALDRHPDITTHVHLDERSSAFFALGIAKATRRPVAVACTSGTAAANFLPAVVEACQSRTPLVLLTADRPPALRGTGANQTIDQEDLYGSYVRWYVETPLPADRAGVVAEWRALGTKAAAAAIGGRRYSTQPDQPGPVHVNLPFREPLTPSDPAGHHRDPTETDGRPHGHPWSESADAHLGAGGSAALDGGVELVHRFRGRTGIVLAGGTWEQEGSALELGRFGWPVIAEPPSGLRTSAYGHRPPALSSGQALISSDGFMRDHRPEVVVLLDSAPTSRAGQELVRSAEHLVVINRRFLDPSPERRGDLVIPTGGQDLMPVLLQNHIRDLRHPVPETKQWLQEWRRADAAARSAIDRLLDTWDEPFEGRIARDLAATIPEGATLVCGSSMPIRDLDYYMAPHPGLRVLANRGASGIDGSISTALGVAAASDGVTYALMGDLALLHDAGSLLWRGGRDELDLVILVPNNDGGVVFSFLPQRELPEHERLFTTPHGLDLGSVASFAGVSHRHIERSVEVVPAVEQAAAAGGVWIVEATIDRELDVRRHAEVQEAVDVALVTQTA